MSIHAFRNKGLATLLAGLPVLALVAWMPFVGLFNLDSGPITVSPLDILRDPGRYWGKRVVVRGEIGEVLGTRAFTVTGRSAAAGPALLITSESDWALLQRYPAGRALLRRDSIQVTGRVRPFRRRDFAGVPDRLPEDLGYRAWEGKPTVLATELEATPWIPDQFPQESAMAAGGTTEEKYRACRSPIKVFLVQAGRFPWMTPRIGFSLPLPSGP